MNAEAAIDIRAFLAHLHHLTADIPLRRVDQQRNVAGHALVQALADSHGPNEQPPYWTPVECADVLQVLCSISPQLGRCYCKDDSTIAGYAEVMHHLHDSILMTSALLGAQDNPPGGRRPYLVIDNTQGSTGGEG
ncbi:MAG TPA: hypothetical protein VN660_01790 [Steroidobacteraceae bacterium]|nr:hypothetical protein [Steroidobacteraceae bacterium]